MNLMQLKETAETLKTTLADKMPDFSLNKPRELSVGILPINNGDWDSERGDSVWTPDDSYIPQKHNPDELTWKEIKDEYGIEGIEFVDGEPDFSHISEGTVEIEDFTADRKLNFMQADEALAEKWTNEGKDEKDWTAADVAAYRKENSLSWHERSDLKTMDLVPSVIHGNVAHSGGISEAKKESQNEYDG